jgi:hypothetical protein
MNVDFLQCQRGVEIRGQSYKGHKYGIFQKNLHLQGTISLLYGTRRRKSFNVIGLRISLPLELNLIFPLHWKLVLGTGLKDPFVLF